MPSCGRVMLLSLCLSAAGCGVEAPSPRLTGARPNAAFSDQVTTLRITGQDLLPRSRIDLGTGRSTPQTEGFTGRVGRNDTWAAVQGVEWLSVTELSGRLDPGLPRGDWDIEITDPRGRTAVLPSGFFSAGTDDLPPTITILQPVNGTPVAVGATLRARFVAIDPWPGRLATLSWEFRVRGQSVAAGPCDAAVLDSQGQTECRVDVPIPPIVRPGEQAAFAVMATDRSVPPNQRQATVELTVVAPPRIVNVSATEGSTLGGNDLVVQGVGFLPGSRVYLNLSLLIPDGGVQLDHQTISGRLPAHVPGTFQVHVETPVGRAFWSGSYTFRPPPLLHEVIPSEGDARGGTPVVIRGTGMSGRTLVLFGPSIDESVPLDKQTLEAGRDGRLNLVGEAPAGMGQARVWVVDPLFGASRTSVPFTWVQP